MKKTTVKMNKPSYLGMLILDISKILMYEFWYNYFIPKHTKDFLKIFLVMLKNGLTRLTIRKQIKYLFQQGKIKSYQAFLKKNWEEK